MGGEWWFIFEGDHSKFNIERYQSLLLKLRSRYKNKTTFHNDRDGEWEGTWFEIEVVPNDNIFAEFTYVCNRQHSRHKQQRFGTPASRSGSWSLYWDPRLSQKQSDIYARCAPFHMIRVSVEIQKRVAILFPYNFQLYLGDGTSGCGPECDEYWGLTPVQNKYRGRIRATCELWHIPYNEQIEIAKRSYGGKDSPLSFDPLILDLVLRNVMSNLSAVILRRCMQISKNWRSKAIMELAFRKKILIDGPRSVLKALYMHYRNNLQEDEAKQFVIGKVNIQNMSMRITMLQKLMKYNSTCLSTLILEDPLGSGNELGTILKILPNLCDLAILGIWREEDDEDIDLSPSSVFPIVHQETGAISNFPNILRFEFISRNRYSTLVNLLSDVLKSFPNIYDLSVINLVPEHVRRFKNMHLGNITVLRLVQEQINEHNDLNISLEMLFKIGLRLRHICLKTHSFYQYQREKLNQQALKRFIESQKESLETLELYQMFIPSGQLCHASAICPFPLDLPNLKVLRIQKPFIKNLAQVLNHLPSLSEIQLYIPAQTNCKCILPNAFKQYENIQTLRVDNIDTPSLDRILQSFKSIKLLEINQCDNYQLAHLVPTLTEHTDFNFSRRFCEKCQTWIRKNRSFEEFVNLKYFYVPRGPELQHLKNLDYLVVRGCIHNPPEVIAFAEQGELDGLKKRLEQTDAVQPNADKYPKPGLKGWIKQQSQLLQLYTETVNVSSLWLTDWDETFRKIYMENERD